MPDLLVADLSRWQFALTAMYHFLFVPLTLGLSMILVITEGAYVMTRKEVWKKITKFWATLFGINFVLGVATGITMEFQFGTNWAYYSHYVGDIFGAPLAIEGLMAFFLEATFVGLMFFGWDKLSRPAHWMVTCFVALGSNLSALWILIANGWMQNPVGSEFNPETMRMEVTNFMEVLFNPVAQAKFVHTVSAGYVTAAAFVLAISAWYLLRGRHVGLAKRSIMVASAFGVLSASSVIVLGDESGYVAGESQKFKLAAIEAMWETEEAPASFTVVGIPDREDRETHFALEVPYVLGLIATRSLDEEVSGINDLIAEARKRIVNGVAAYDALQRIRANPEDAAAQEAFAATREDLGHGLLLMRYVDDPRQATEDQINAAADDLVPNVALTFWGFRFMVGIGFLYLAIFAAGFYFMNLKRNLPRWYLHIAVLAAPLPWLAAEFGWLVAEVGRQPWIIDGVLPTHLGVSSVSAGHVITTMVGFTALYGVLLIIEMRLMLRAIRLGPSGGPVVPLGGGGISDAIGISRPATPHADPYDK
ncbi:cytochrome ubiquinol oxidase subunit I [Henriciella aquimarina]|uniref:cytochrome ubiquinol oxidase subunit I n=1 Tax=Henriciella aquimarina TaxID=545261 RepID=UPI000A052143|nr:cytochrome ubiquinol oxidase subunit I [Henriciella aquimarina]